MSQIFDSWRGGGKGRGAYTLTPRSTSEIPLTIDLLAGQTANGFRIRNSGGTTIFSVDPSGNMTLGGTATISISETVTGDLSLTGNLSVTGTSTFGNSVLFSSDTTIDIGQSASGRPRDVYIGRTLTVSGTSTLNSAILNGTLTVSDGNASGPSLSFKNENNLGFYRSASGTISLSISGTQYLTIASTGSGKGISLKATAIVDGATAIAYVLNTTALANASSKLLSIQNNGSEKVNVTYAGGMTIQGGFTAASLNTSGALQTNTIARINPGFMDISGGETTDAASNIGVKLRSYRTFNTAGAKIVSFQNNTTEKAYVTLDGYLGWITANTQSTVGAAGGASALPATPTGYTKIDVNGTTYVQPYYAAS